MKQTSRKSATLNEFWSHLSELESAVSEWDACFTVSASGTEKKLGTFMVHGYQPLNQLNPHVKCTHSYVINTEFPVDYDWFFPLASDLRDSLLEEGRAVMPQDGMNVSHLFHIGAGFISFGVSLDDEEAYMRYLRGDYGKMKIKEIKEPFDYEQHRS